VCAGVHDAIVRAGAHILVCDVTALASADEAALETVTRLQLTAKRTHTSLRLVGVAPRLDDLLGAVGLGGVVRERSVVAVDGHAEEREQRGVDEVVDPGDSAV
jgi:anti-anti-sigma regulatory factor